MANADFNSPKVINLTPNMFRELDILARTHGGCVLVVKRHDELKGVFARQGFLATDIYFDEAVRTGKGICDDASGIEIANQINVNDFHTTKRPEITWQKVPECDIYKFILFHEIGHKVNNYDFLDVIKSFTPEHGHYLRVMNTVNEVLADRYAWESLYPGTSLPLYDYPKEYFEKLESYQQDLNRHVQVKLRTPKPIPTEPGKYIPVEHVRHGIPWAA